MELKGKALFNLLRMSWIDDRNPHVKQWQIEDLQNVSIEELFSNLKSLGVILDEQSFNLYAENCSSPEELVDCVFLEEEDSEDKDRVYLILFELWKRLLPEKMCLSVFCDGLDQLIDFYDQGVLEDEEALQRALSFLQDLLDDISDKSGSKQSIFAEIASYCAHDLENFICDYIWDQIDEGNLLYGSELLDAFFDYSGDKRRFDLLRAKLFAFSDLEESNILYGRILEELSDQPDVDLLLRVAESLIHHGDVRLFMQAIRQALPLLEREEQLQNLLIIVAEYYRCLDRDVEEALVKSLLQERALHSVDKPIDPKDKAIDSLSHLVSRSSAG